MKLSKIIEKINNMPDKTSAVLYFGDFTQNGLCILKIICRGKIIKSKYKFIELDIDLSNLRDSTYHLNNKRFINIYNYKEITSYKHSFKQQEVDDDK